MPSRWLGKALFIALFLGGGQLASFLIAIVRAPTMPVVGKVLIGFFLSIALTLMAVWMSKHRAQDLELARTAAPARVNERIAELDRARLPALRDPYAYFALHLAAGRIGQAEHILSRSIEGPVGSRLKLKSSCRAALALAQQLPGAAADVIATVEVGPRAPILDGPMRTAQERICAMLVARAGVVTTSTTVAAAALAKLVARSDDAEIAAYASWIRAKFDSPLDPSERPEQAERGAALARVAGLEELALAVDRRATLLRAAARPHAYR